jgi:signal transduction histidine kinase/ActR/RegA family two-component response regulator
VVDHRHRCGCIASEYEIKMFQPNPEAIPFAIAAAVSGSLAVLAWRRRSLPMAPAFTIMMAGEAAWALFEAIELACNDLVVQGLCYELRTAGAVITILGLLAFVLRYTGSVHWLEPSHFAAVCAPALALTVVAWTNPLHHLYWVAHEPLIEGQFRFAIPVYAPAFWVHFGYCYILVAVSAFLLAQAAVQSAGVYRAQAVVMLFAVIVPWIVNIVDMSQVFGYIHIDTAAMTFAVTGLAFLPGLFRFRLLDLTPVAWAVVVKGMNDPVVVFDPSCRIVELNQAAVRLIGRPYSELLGADAASAFAHWGALLVRLKGFKAPLEYAFEIDGPDPDMPSSFDARISRLGEDIHPAGWVLVLRDVTLQKRAALERVRMLREQAARAEAEATNLAKDRFLATLSHELRTPLTPVLATVTAMLGDSGTPDALRSILEMIRRNVVLEVRLIDDLLDLSRIRRGSLHLHREIVDAHQLIHNVIDICREDLRIAELQLQTNLLASQHHLNADPIRFQQALWNLIKNAIKFTPSGGKITIISLNSDGDTRAEGIPDVVIGVSDTGIGIKREVLPHIFDVLEQGGTSATRRFGGLGLGLTISRSIVEQHGGRLTAHSLGANMGATFTIAMPTTAPPILLAIDDAPVAVPISHDDALARPIRILLVDDNHDTLKYLSRLLSLRGYHVHTAADMASALKVGSQAELDVIVSDIELPDGSGHELVGCLRHKGRPIPAIALSGFGSSADVELSHSAGFAIHLTKPVDFRQLEEAIRQVAASAVVETLVNG